MMMIPSTPEIAKTHRANRIGCESYCSRLASLTASWNIRIRHDWSSLPRERQFARPETADPRDRVWPAILALIMGPRAHLGRHPHQRELQTNHHTEQRGIQ